MGTLSDYVEFSPSPNLECSEQGNVVHHLLLLVVHHLHDHLFSHEFEHLFRPPFIVNKRISPVNICYHLCIVHLVDNLLLLLVVKRLRGHRINNFLDYLSRVTQLHISTTMSANYLGKYCVRFYKQYLAMAIHILRSRDDDLHLLIAHLQAFRCLDRASTFAAKKDRSKDVVCLREKKVIVVICAGKSNIRRVDDICTITEM